MILVSQFVIAQSTEISGKYDKIGKFQNGLAIVRKGSLYGAINTQGKEVIKPAYDHISGFKSTGLAYTRKNNLVGLVDSTGKVIANNEYDHIGSFRGNNAVVKKGRLSGVINRQGKLIVDIKYEKLKCEQNGVIIAINPDKTQVLVKPNS